jgi:hypothetical protein
MSNFKYRVRYTRKSDTGAAIPCTQDIYGVSAISALNHFHREMQLSREVGEDRKTIIRPKLGPKDYIITKISHIFNSDPTGKQRGEVIESDFDLPGSARNPDLTFKQPSFETEAMGFMTELRDGRLAK